MRDIFLLMGIVGIIALTAVLYGTFVKEGETAETMELVNNSEPIPQPIEPTPKPQAPIEKPVEKEVNPPKNTPIPAPKKPIAKPKPIAPEKQPKAIDTPQKQTYTPLPPSTTSRVIPYTPPVVSPPKSIEPVTPYVSPTSTHKPVPVQPAPAPYSPPAYTPPTPTPEELEAARIAREKVESERIEQERIAAEKAKAAQIALEEKRAAAAAISKRATEKRNKENTIAASLKAIIRNKNLGDDYDKIIRIARDETPVSILKNNGPKESKESSELYKYCQDIAIRELQKNISRVEITEDNNIITHITIYEN